MKNKGEKITFVVVLAAVIAALTTVGVLLVRMMLKKSVCAPRARLCSI